MTVDREITVAAPPDRVWQFLWSIDRVARCLPGCKDVRTVTPHERYETTVSERVGPFKVQFPLEIRVLEANAPTRLLAEAAGRDASLGTSLTVVLDLRIEPQPDGPGSRLFIHSDINIGGKLAALGQGIIKPKANGIMTQFAEAMRQELEADRG